MTLFSNFHCSSLSEINILMYTQPTDIAASAKSVSVQMRHSVISF